jgi:hypothetical protein
MDLLYGLVVQFVATFAVVQLIALIIALALRSPSRRSTS